MNQRINLTPKQQIIFNEFKKSDFLKQNFYFTGGTALSAVYLNHRLSEDLDFFSQEKFDTLPIENLITAWGQKYQFKINLREEEVVKVFLLQFEDKEQLKVDFGYYPYKRLRPGQAIDCVEIDSLFDIAVNKLQTIHQRENVKDFVDLYFLLKDFTVWDLIEGVRIKFRMEVDPYTIAAAYLKAERFDSLPKMLVSLDLSELQAFYKDLAKKLGKSVVKP
ncbi:nucleotidyl transferase AbiEii/AbiGii toxin family protein [Candidatus Daviesbacteria bacterium]|nr:nucleotidyl transferase AbiEii/AbiGii toxin family protein [Candidatus Daviesbacteria bacterium]